MNEKAIVYVELKPGLCARVEVCVIEEPLPSPHEMAVRREPFLTEFDAIAGKLSAKDYRSTPPFDV